MQTNSSRHNPAAGFTLVELMVAMAVASILMTALYGFYSAYSRTIAIQNASAWAQQNLRTGMALMTRDIRMAGFDPTGTASAGLEESKKQKIRVTSDRNGDGNIEQNHYENITYKLSGTDLRRILYEGSSSQSSRTVVENVSKLEFRYSGSEIAVALAVKEPAGMEETVTRSLETRLYCRNLDL
ncbi:MAG: prepilin-type N-terminal cleavage/methylation domain-containing protein [Desulfosalsimonadaceae bacterium]